MIAGMWSRGMDDRGRASFELASAKSLWDRSRFQTDRRRQNKAWGAMHLAGRLKRQARFMPRVSMAEQTATFSSSSIQRVPVRDGRLERENARRQYSVGGLPTTRDNEYWIKHPNALMARLLVTTRDPTVL